jgi:hypothetical protein
VSVTLGLLNVGLGLVYTQYGTMTLWEMVRNRRSMGFSHFGAAWVAMAFTCGPHHLAHGAHLLAGGRGGGILDLIAVLVGLPAGVIWFVLRVEACRGGTGDRFIPGTPLWILALPTLAGIYLTALVAATVSAGPLHSPDPWTVVPQFMLLGLYMAIGYFLARTQIANHRPLGGWSLSGLALAVVFPTCALMHTVYAYYSLTGQYAIDRLAVGIDIVAVPAAMYFLWVVHSLYRGSYHDWNGAPAAAETIPLGPAPAGATTS